LEEFVPGDGVPPTDQHVPAAQDQFADSSKLFDGEPLVSLLSESDMAVLGVSESDLAGLYGDELVVYRLVGDGTSSRWDSAEAVKAHARLSGRAWALWLLKNAGGMVPQEYLGPGGPVPNSMRDARIVELRRSGWTLAAIATEVGLSSKAAVSQALSRIACELERPPLKGPRLHRHPEPSEEW
jgi:hypothetical protein